MKILSKSEIDIPNIFTLYPKLREKVVKTLFDNAKLSEGDYVNFRTDPNTSYEILINLSNTEIMLVKNE